MVELPACQAQEFFIRVHPRKSAVKFSPPLPPFLCVSKVLDSRRRLPHRHHHQPRSICHEKHNGRKEILVYRHVLKNAPYHASDNQQVDHNVSDKDFGAWHGRFLFPRKQ